jgi:8-oxo-dGTP pyrophosphatase MutT (NUDIX family)
VTASPTQPSESSEPVARVAARVLLLDRHERLLLFQGIDPHEPGLPPFWFTAGGGVEPGEEQVDAAVREVREETGIAVAPERLVGPVWLRRARFTFESVRYLGEEWFFLARPSGPVAVDTAGFNDVELRSVRCHRWWTTAELRATGDTVYPRQLAELLPGLIAGGWDGGLRLID